MTSPSCMQAKAQTTEEMQMNNEITTVDTSAGNNAQPAPMSFNGNQQKQPVRRIGVYTLGLALIFCGVLLAASCFNPSFDYITAAKFSPCILIFLGVEIIISSIVIKNARIKYDFLSGFICLVLIAASICMSIVPQAIKIWGPERHRIEAQLENELYERCYPAVKNIKGVGSFDVNIYLGDSFNGYNDKLTVASLTPRFDHVSADVTLIDSYESPEQFAQVCRNVAVALNAERNNIGSAYIRTADDRFYLNLDNKTAFNLDAEGMAKLVQVMPGEADDNIPPVDETVTDDIPAPPAPPEAADAPEVI